MAATAFEVSLEPFVEEEVVEEPELWELLEPDVPDGLVDRLTMPHPSTKPIISNRDKTACSCFMYSAIIT